MQHQDVLERPAKSYMQRQFVTIEENASVASAVQEMQSHKLESVIVTRQGLAIGMVTTGDVVEKVVLKGEDSNRTSLKSVMTFPLVTISSIGTVRQALQLMRLNRIKRVPVTDNTGIIGVVTQRSLADAVSKSVLERTLDRARSTFKMRYKPVLGDNPAGEFATELQLLPVLHAVGWRALLCVSCNDALLPGGKAERVEERAWGWNAQVKGIHRDPGGHILRVQPRANATSNTHRPDCKHLCSFCSVCNDYRRRLFADIRFHFAGQHWISRGYKRRHDTLRATVRLPLLHF